MYMELRLPFDAAPILRQTKLAEDHPDVWRRYAQNIQVSVSSRDTVRIKTDLGKFDLFVIRKYFEKWLAEEHSKEDERLRPAVRNAVHVINEALCASMVGCRHATADN